MFLIIEGFRNVFGRGPEAGYYSFLGWMLEMAVFCFPQRITCESASKSMMQGFER